jgi:hypothetical protein
MSKLRLSIILLCVLAAGICAIIAKPKPRTPKQKAQDKCDMEFIACTDTCFRGVLSAEQSCRDACEEFWMACYKKAGIETPSTPPKVTNRPPQATASAAPTASPHSSPKKIQPQGTLTQASPTATPKRTLGTHGDLPQATTTASPNRILNKTKKGKKN